jgi:ariadne-1
MSGNEKAIFEQNQGDLEHAVEQLSEYLERDMNEAELPALKQAIQDKCA